MLCVGGALALAIGLAIFIAKRPSHPATEPESELTMLERTNDPTNGPSVLLSLTNKSDSEMPYFVSSARIKDTNSFEVNDPYGSGLHLLPHQATNFVVKIPSETRTWSVTVSYTYLPSGMERWRNNIRFNVRENWNRLKSLYPLSWNKNYTGIDSFAIYPAEVTIPPKPDPRAALN